MSQNKFQAALAKRPASESYQLSSPPTLPRCQSSLSIFPNPANINLLPLLLSLLLLLLLFLFLLFLLLCCNSLTPKPLKPNCHPYYYHVSYQVTTCWNLPGGTSCEAQWQIFTGSWVDDCFPLPSKGLGLRGLGFRGPTPILDSQAATWGLGGQAI